jgi:histidinol phosphatase-like PHP family hydrolase
LQLHSVWSDGSDTLASLVKEAVRRQYEFLAVTDHSHGLPIAGGMSQEAAARQHQEIDRLNQRFPNRFRLLKGVEANILADGQLDLTAEELQNFELVVAAPHSKLRVAEDQTARMLGAVATPGVHVLGHPRGRMSGSRAGVQADWPRVFRAAAARRVAIEIDGDPSRQDIDFDLARQALDAGCLFALDSDAHSADELRYSETALAHARLAGIPSSRVVNCWNVDRLLDWANERKTIRTSRRAARTRPLN